jgi:hypothetical protein
MKAMLERVRPPKLTLDEQLGVIREQVEAGTDALRRLTDQMHYLRSELARLAEENREMRMADRRAWVIGAVGVAFWVGLARWFHRF